VNLKFCLATNKLNHDIKKTMLNLEYSVRTKFHHYIPQDYMKKKTWNPPPASKTIENQLTSFKKSLSF
jgi:hypothetical protein